MLVPQNTGCASLSEMDKDTPHKYYIFQNRALVCTKPAISNIFSLVVFIDFWPWRSKYKYIPEIIKENKVSKLLKYLSFPCSV